MKLEMLILIPILFLACTTTKPVVVHRTIHRHVIHHHDQDARQAIIEVLTDREENENE